MGFCHRDPSVSDEGHRRLIDVLNLQALFMRNEKIIHIVQAILRPMVMVLG